MSEVIASAWRDRVEVAVVGAGAAGLACARALAAAGVEALVLEARGRVGGRAHTQAHDGFPMDLGCGWLHSADRNPMQPRARELGFTVDDTPPPWMRPAHHNFPSEAQAAWRAAYEAFEGRIAEAARSGPDRACGELMEPGGRWNALIDAVGTWYSGAPYERVSAQDYDAYEDRGVDRRVVEGYGALVVRAGAGARVVTDTPVTLIDRRGPELALHTPRGVLRARAAVVTVPTPALAEDRLRFDPPLPEKAEAAAGLPLGLADKVSFRLAEPEEFPAETLLLGSTERTDTGGYHLRPFHRPLIEGFLGADLARLLEHEGPGAAHAFALDELCAAIGSDFRKRAAPLTATAWAIDPWARGSYSYALPGRRLDRAALAAPVEDRLFFAGEATHETLFSTAHGAWLSGERAAAEALRALGRG